MPSTKSSSILRHQQQLAMRSIRSSATPQSAPGCRFFGFAIKRRGYFGMSTNAFIVCLCLLWSKFTLSWNDRPFASRSPLVTTSETKLKLLLWKILPRSFTFQTNPVVIAHITWCRLLPLLLFNRSSLDQRDQSVYYPHLAIGVDVKIFNISICWAVSRPKTALLSSTTNAITAVTLSLLKYLLVCPATGMTLRFVKIVSALSAVFVHFEIAWAPPLHYSIYACPEIDQVSRLSLNLPLNLSSATRFEHIS